MRKFHLLQLALAGLLFAGCSSDDLTDGGNSESSKTKGYMSFAINLPSTASTRAGWGDNATGIFDDGDEKEYAIESATAYLFDDNNNLVEISPCTLKRPTEDIENNENVTTKAMARIDADHTPTSVLVVLNPKGLPTSLTTPITYNELNAELTDMAASDFATMDATTGIATNIMMANAPIVVDNKVQTLVPVSATKIHSSQTEADEDPVTIYVERILAKVTVDKATNMSTPENVTVTFTGWDLDVTNTKTYPVRIMKDDWLNDATYTINGTNRFYGTATNPRRTYFAQDPNYDTSPTSDFTFVDKDANTAFPYVLGTSTTQKYVGYCLENTFTIANMDKDKTTSVVLKATYVPTSQTSFTGTTLDGYDATNNNNLFVHGIDNATLYSTSGIAALIKNYVINRGEDFDLTVDATTIAVSEDKLKGLSSTGELQLDETFFTAGVTPGNNANWTGLSDYIDIKVYAGSVCYYTVQIKHFGDVLTPWNAETSTSYTEAQHLGRYGVVRNNWYDLTINKVSSIGDPVPVTPDEPDDNTEYNYISFSINVLSWAKRSQGVDL